jgi:hypothetical protein
MRGWVAGGIGMMLLAVSVVAQAPHALDGAWHGETRNGSAIVLTLSVKADALTGTLTRNGEPTALQDGKVSDQRFSFKATLNDQTEAVSGEIADDAIKVWLDRQGAESAITLRRAKGE